VLDGWWAEAYDGTNGWGIVPHGDDFDPAFRDRQEASDLYDLLEHQVIPLYFDRSGHSYSPDWVAMAKASMSTILPRFNAERMVLDYVQRLYGPAQDQRRRIESEPGGALALAEWKQHVHERWPGVTLMAATGTAGEGRRLLAFGDALELRVEVGLNGLEPDDVVVECLLGEQHEDGTFVLRDSLTLTPDTSLPGGAVTYRLALRPGTTGLQHFRIRAYPYHPLLAHRFELGCMTWL
jgi:starch phosphorylase